MRVFQNKHSVGTVWKLTASMAIPRQDLMKNVDGCYLWSAIRKIFQVEINHGKCCWENRKSSKKGMIHKHRSVINKHCIMEQIALLHISTQLKSKEHSHGRLDYVILKGKSKLLRTIPITQFLLWSLPRSVTMGILRVSYLVLQSPWER